MPEAATPTAAARSWFDDPWGIMWRVGNAVRRFDARRTGRFFSALASGKRYSRPVFVIGAPRSGTTMLFRLLRASSGLASMPYEGHDLWRAFHHPRLRGWKSDCLQLGDALPGERRFADAFIHARSETRANRFVEKTPENSLRIGYLLDLYPDASFVVMKRDPCDVISSLVQGWFHPRAIYRSYYLPKDLNIPGYPHRRRWCFALIENWRSMTSQPVPEIAFEQWRQCCDAIRSAESFVPPSQWHVLNFEDLLEQPGRELAKLCAAIGIAQEPALERELAHLIAEPANAMSPPGLNKWRVQSPEAVRPLLPRIAEEAEEFGYKVDPATGDFTIVR